MIFFDDMSDDAKLHDSHGLIAEIFFETQAQLYTGSMQLPKMEVNQYGR